MSYDELLLAHAATLRALLPTLPWPLVPGKVERFGPLTKYTLGPLPDGRWAMLHHLSAADEGPAHCHPCEMESHILVGGYWERLYLPLGGTKDVRRDPGSRHVIAADCIHRILALPAGECWSLCLAGPVIRQWRHHPELT